MIACGLFVYMFKKKSRVSCLLKWLVLREENKLNCPFIFFPIFILRFEFSFYLLNTYKHALY